MFITDKTILKQYAAPQRLWQGIPSIEVTKKGRIYLAFYSGGTKEEIGNFVVLARSDDGVNYTEPLAVVCREGNRCFDPGLWIDPLGRLWLTWTQYPNDGLYGMICEDPDADEPVFGEEFFIGHNVMMCKPTVLSSGEWLFPLAVWHEGMTVQFPGFGEGALEKGAYAYATEDNGQTFKRLGYTALKDRSFDEHQFLELKDGRVRMFVRTRYGIGAADSFDGGKTWTEGFDTGYGGPSSRFHITRLRSGRVLLINHLNFTGRNNLTAMLSEDDGKTFPYTLLLDERSRVSYPDVKEADDGYLYITYDRERGAFKSALRDIMDSAREILVARITEEDILHGAVQNSGSYLKRVVSKLTDYEGPIKNPFNEPALFNDEEYARYLNHEKLPEMVIQTVFDVYPLSCSHLRSDVALELDKLISQYLTDRSMSTLSRIISLVRSMPLAKEAEANTLAREVRSYVSAHLDRNDSVQSIAAHFNISANYLMHIFKKYTGTTLVGYRNAQRLVKAKLLIRGSQDTITHIASECGYDNPSYFTEFFTKEVGMSPSRYRKLQEQKEDA